MSDKRDYYDVLEVDRGADEAAIKKAFRKKAMQYHPDRNDAPDAEDRFKEIQEAYAVLSDSQKRASYDRFGHQGVDMGAGFQGFQGGFGDIFGDIFGEIFGGGRGRTRARRGAHLEYTLDLEFEEAAFGCEKEISLPRTEGCKRCSGTGAATTKDLATCGQCGGSGQLHISQGFFQISQPCVACRGEGKIIKKPCESCGGQGAVRKTKTYTVQVPPGADDNVRIRLPGQGEEGLNGGPPGDLFVRPRVAPHEVFRREGNDIWLDQPVSFPQATLGAAITVPTLHGDEELEIPAGTQPGTVLTLEGKGTADVHGGRPGDQHVKVVLQVPRKLSKEQEDLLRAYAHAGGEKVEAPEEGFLDRVKHTLADLFD